MRSAVIIVILLVVVGFSGWRFWRARSAPDLGWPTNYSVALEQAKAQNKLVLADFTGSDWCGFCIQLRQEVLSTPEFQQWAESRLIPVEIDFPQSKPQPPDVVRQNQELQRQFGVDGFPTVIILDSQGRELGRVTGYSDKSAWMAEAAQIVARHRAQ